VLGVSPDVDYFVALAFSDAAQLSIHRTYTHSLLALVVVALVAGWAFKRRYGDAGVAVWHGVALGGGIWGSHVLIDAMTSYGVQLLVPFSDTPVALYTIAILDPLVTVPVAVGVLGALRLPRLAARRRWWNAAGLMLAGAYLAWALIAQQQAHAAFETMLQTEGITAERSFVKPTLLNTLLWRGLAETDTA
jgi:inner membrane protein